MVKNRKQKIDNVQKEVPDLIVDGDQEGELLVLSWGGTYGSIKEATTNLRAKGIKVSHAHLRYINPFPKKC